MRYLAAALGSRPGNRVFFLAEEQAGAALPGVNAGLVPVPLPRGTANAPEYALLAMLRRAEAFANAMLQLRRKGFAPDRIVERAGSGAGLFSADVFPRAAGMGYFPALPSRSHPHVLNEEERNLPDLATRRLRGLYLLDSLAVCKIAVCATVDLRESYPPGLRHLLRVLPDPVDTDFFSPAAEGAPPALALPKEFIGKRIISYAPGFFEPARGFLQFWRALPGLFEKDGDCRVLIMGEDSVSLDAPRPDGLTWLEAMRAEAEVDESRVRLLPPVPQAQRDRALLALLRGSDLHVDLSGPDMAAPSTYQAMSCGCPVLAREVPAVKELLRDGESGFIAPPDDPSALTERMLSALGDPDRLQAVRAAARRTAQERLGLAALLPLHLRLLHLAGAPADAARAVRSPSGAPAAPAPAAPAVPPSAEP